MAKKDLEPMDLPPPTNPFRRAVLRGLAVVLPPLLTIVIFVWIGNTVAVYLLEPLESGAEWAFTEWYANTDVLKDLPDVIDGEAAHGETVYKQVRDGKFVPLLVYDTVQKEVGAGSMPVTAKEVYGQYVQIKILKRHIVIPVFLCLFILVLYLLGKFIAAGVGHFFWTRVELVIHRLPLIRNVYSSVKQVTDFMFSEREIEYTRVVAVEYPRKGIWSLGLVTGESMLDVQSAANEPVFSVLIPTSPMPMTGFTVTVKQSETVDLNITIDQAFQFIVSCGVVVPPHQMQKALAAGLPGSAGHGLPADEQKGSAISA